MSQYRGTINTLKQLTGENCRIERKMVQGTGSFIYKGHLIMISNEVIMASDLSTGLARRRVVSIYCS